MIRLQLLHPAEPGERFARTAWDNQIGKKVPFNIGERHGSCTLIAAEVSEDGSSVQLTIETEHPNANALVETPAAFRQRSGMSIGFTPIPAEPLRTDRSDWDPQ